MSESSLWGIKEDFIGEEISIFKNSWIFTPVMDNILFRKYLPEYIIHDCVSYITSVMFDNSIPKELNNKINNCKVNDDRIVWELTNQQIFCSSDKEVIGQAIISFFDSNKEENEFNTDVINRVHEVAAEIQNIDISKYPYFVFKNSNCDDNVKCWFQTYNPKTEEYEASSLLDIKDKIVTELVMLDNDTGDIIGFKSNMELRQIMRDLQ